MRSLSNSFANLVGAQSRATRQEFINTLSFLLFVGIPMTVANRLIEWHQYGVFNHLLGSVFLAAIFAPYHVLVARRLHDLGMSGRYCLFGTLTMACGVIAQTTVSTSQMFFAAMTLCGVALHLPLLIKNGQKGPNLWGADPQPERQFLYLSTLAKSFDFETRASRREFWGFICISWLIAICCALIDLFLISRNQQGYIMPLTILFAVATFLPNVAVSVRRIHDVGSSGWYFLVTLFPFVGSLIMIRYALLSGEPGPNRFGPKPLR